MATILHNESAWSTTVASNANSDTGVNWAEGQDAATVNNSARGMMTARANARLDQGGALVAGGTANALTVTTNQVLSAAHLAAGQRLLVRATADNTSTTVTFAPDGLTAQNIRRSDGSSLLVGDIRSDMMLDLVYNAVSSNWRAINIIPQGAGAAAFRAFKTADQTISSTVSTKISWPSTAFDTGSHFSSGAWTPPAGTVLMTARVNYAGIGSGTVAAAIYKNNTAVAVSREPDSTGSVRSITIQYIDRAGGTDYYEVFSSTSADASYTITSGGDESTFSGTMIL